MELRGGVDNTDYYRDTGTFGCLGVVGWETFDFLGAPSTAGLGQTQWPQHAHAVYHIGVMSADPAPPTGWHRCCRRSLRVRRYALTQRLLRGGRVPSGCQRMMRLAITWKRAHSSYDSALFVCSFALFLREVDSTRECVKCTRHHVLLRCAMHLSVRFLWSCTDLYGNCHSRRCRRVYFFSIVTCGWMQCELYHRVPSMVMTMLVTILAKAT